MIRSATVSETAKVVEVWQAAGLRFYPETAERELAAAISQDLALIDEQPTARSARRSSRPATPASAASTRGWSDIRPDLHAEPYVFAAGEPPPGAAPFALIREDEGLTLILTRAAADEAGLAYDYVAARITLRVNSALTAIGLTALFSRILADAGISCNVIAGLAHDHLFVDWDQRGQAVALLDRL